MDSISVHMCECVDVFPFEAFFFYLYLKITTLWILPVTVLRDGIVQNITENDQQKREREREKSTIDKKEQLQMNSFTFEKGNLNVKASKTINVFRIPFRIMQCIAMHTIIPCDMDSILISSFNPFFISRIVLNNVCLSVSLCYVWVCVLSLPFSIECHKFVCVWRYDCCVIPISRRPFLILIAYNFLIAFFIFFTSSFMETSAKNTNILQQNQTI